MQSMKGAINISSLLCKVTLLSVTSRTFPKKERERGSIRRRERKRKLFKKENRIATPDGELRVKIRCNIFPRFFFAQVSDVLRTADQYPIKRGWSTACLSIYYIRPSRGLWSTLPWIFEPLTEDVRRKRD